MEPEPSNVVLVIHNYDIISPISTYGVVIWWEAVNTKHNEQVESAAKTRMSGH